MRTKVRKRATTVTTKRMFIVDKSNIICHARRDSSSFAYRLDETCIISPNI
jgi:hypothetical protein